MKPIRTLRRAITWAGLGLAGGALVVTTRHLLSIPQPLESGLAGEGRIARRREGDIYYNVAGPQNAEPLVLLHDFYPGASNYEFRRVFSRLAADHRLYALDWLGFGMSERPALAYTGEFYAHLLAGFLRDTVARPATVLADGLAGNVAVRAASDEPALFSRLVLVSPRPLAGTQPAPTATQTAARAAQRTALGLVPYAALATRAGLRWELRRRAAHAGEGTATDDAVDHAYASAHQFGGHYAPLALLIGDLDLPMANVFALLEAPVLMVAGELDSPQRRLQMEDLTLLNAHARMLTLRGAGEVVHEDQPDAFAERVSLWLKTTNGRRAPTPASPPTPSGMSRTEAASVQQEAQRVEEPRATVTGGIFDAAEAGAEQAEAARGTADRVVPERFGEARGLTTPASEMDALGGLMEQAPGAKAEGQAEATPEPPDGSDFMPLDVAGNVSGAGSPPETRTVGKPAGEMEEAGSPERGDVQAEPAPAHLERTLEAPSDSAAQGPAPDQLRSEMSTPEAPVPTTLSAMTAPLDADEAHEEEGTIEPKSGPHPVPADARTHEERPTPAPRARQESADAVAPAPDADEQEEVIVLPEPSDEGASARADVSPTGRGSGKDAEVGAATRDTAAKLADQEERVAKEMQRADERTRSQTPHRANDEAPAPPAPAEAEAVPPHVTAGAEKPGRPSQAQRSGPRRGRDAPPHAAPDSTGKAGEQATREGKSGQSAKGARSNSSTRPGATGQKRSGRKSKRSH